MREKLSPSGEDFSMLAVWRITGKKKGQRPIKTLIIKNLLPQHDNVLFSQFRNVLK